MSGRPKERLEITTLNTPNWITEGGVYKKRKQIESKGLPDFTFCKHVTLTLDPAIGNPKEAYEIGKDRMRRFFDKIRSVIGEFPWAWRLEFQENEYAHWHVIIVYRQKIPQEFLQHFTRWWNLGRVKVQGLTTNEFNYMFKYLSKESTNGFDTETGLSLPSWVLDYEKELKDGRKSKGMRFWQTGGEFYTKMKEAKENPESEKLYSLLQITLRERYFRYIRKAKAVIRTSEGKIIQSVQFNLSGSYGQFLHQISKLILHGKATPCEGEHFVKCRFEHILKENIICHSQKILTLQFLHPNLATAYVSQDWW